MPNVTKSFLTFSVSKLREFEQRIEACIGKLTPEQVWARGTANENAIGNLVLHLSGNVRQWIIATLGGAPDERTRDAEFAASAGDTAEMLARLRATVEEACAVISSRTEEQLLARYQVQNYDSNGIEVIYHVVEHFALHYGQITFATKLLTGEDLGFYRHL